MIFNKFKLKVISILILRVIISYNSHASSNLQDLSIVVASCDKYSGLWDPFFSLLFKYWPSLVDPNNKPNVPIFLIANKKTFNDPRIQHVLFPNEKSWSNNMIETLSKVKTRYVLYLQEDYFLTNTVDQKLLSKILECMNTHQAAYLEVSAFNSMVQQVESSNLKCKVDNIHAFTKHSPYRTSLQAAIWDKESLIWLLKSGETAVDFEVTGSTRSEGITKLFLAYTDYNSQPVKYINAVIGGILLQSALDHLNSEHIVFNHKLQPLPTEQGRKLVIIKRKIFKTLKNQTTKIIFNKCKYYLQELIYS